MRLPDDVVRDALGMVEAVHCGDTEGVFVLLDHGDNRLMCAFLARVACDLVEAWADDDSAEMLCSLREHYS